MTTTYPTLIAVARATGSRIDLDAMLRTAISNAREGRTLTPSDRVVLRGVLDDILDEISLPTPAVVAGGVSR